MEEQKEFKITEIKEEQSEKASKTKKIVKEIIKFGLGNILLVGGATLALPRAVEMQNLPFPLNVFSLVGALTIIGTGEYLNWKSWDSLGKLDDSKEIDTNERKR